MVWWTCPDDSKKVWQFYVDLILFAISLINVIKKKSYWQLFSDMGWVNAIDTFYMIAVIKKIH